MKMALLERDFQDAVHEMDGPRLLRLWKFKMLHFKEAGRSKYALEACMYVCMYVCRSYNIISSNVNTWKKQTNKCNQYHYLLTTGDLKSV